MKTKISSKLWQTISRNTMSDAKKDVMKLIAKKQQKNSAYKTRAAKRAGPNGIVMQFIDAMEKIKTEARNSLEFDTGLQREARMLHDNMKAIDHGVNVEVCWAENEEEDWKNLNVDGVKIMWSDYHLAAFPQKSKELYIDVGSLLLEGHLTD
jgi:hypothetical protein